MKFIALAFLGVALATYSSPALPVPLKVNTEYRYQFKGSLESGLPINDAEASVSRINSNVIFQVVDERTVLFRLKNVKVASDHKESGSKILPIEALETRILAPEHQKTLETPVKFHYRNGLVSELQFAPEEPVWSANIKRAVINMIHLNINKVGRELEEETRSTENINDFFTASEKNIEGECQVAYTTVEDNKDSIIITKSINFDKCTKRPEVRYNLRYFSDCQTCSPQSKIVSPQTLYTFKMEKEQLQESEVTAFYNMPLEETTLKTEVRSRLILKETSEIRDRMEVSEGKKEDIIFNTEWEEKVERFFKNGDEEDNMIFEPYSGKIELVEKILIRSSKIEKNDEETVHILARLVRAFRMSSVSDLKNIHQTIFQTAEPKQKSLMEHALAIAGTKNTITHLLFHITNREIHPRLAVQLFKEMQDTVYPSVAIANMLITFSKSDVVVGEPALRQSVWLCIGSVVRGIVSPKNEVHLVQEDTLKNKEKYLEIIVEELEQAKSTYEKVLFVKTLANANIDISISKLEQIIRDRKQETVVRIEAIDALRLIGEQMPRKVQRILMPIHISTIEKPEIRMNALILILKTQPEQPVITQIVFNMNHEPNQQVAAFTYRTLTSLVKSSNPCYKTVSSRISPLLSESQYKPKGKVLSSFHSMSYFEDNISGLTINLATMFGQESDLPKSIVASIDAISNQKWIRGFMQFGMSQQNVEQLFNKLINRVQKLEKKITRGSRLSQPVNLIKELARKMNIRIRTTDREDPYAQIYLRHKQMDYAILPIDEKILDSIIEKYLQDGIVSFKHLLDYSKEFDFTHASFLQEDVMKIPTALGLPLSFTSKTPSVFSAKGKLSSKVTSKGYSLRFTAEPHSALTQVHEVRTWTPILEQGIKHLEACRTTLPIDIELDLEIQRGYEIQIKQRVPEMEYQLFQCGRRSTAYFRYPQHHNIHAYVEVKEKTLRPANWKNKVAEDNLVFEGFSHKISIRNWKVEGMTLGESDIELTVQPTQRPSRYFTLKLKIEEPKKERIEIPKIEVMIDNEMEVEYDDDEGRHEEMRREEMQKYVREISVVARRVIGTVGTEDEQINIDFRWMTDEKLKFFRYLISTRFPAEYSEWNMKSKVDILLPLQHQEISYDKIQELKHREVQMSCETTWGTRDENNVNIKIQLEQSKDQRHWTKKSELRGIDESEHLLETTRLNQLKAVVEYNIHNMESQVAFDRFFSLLRGKTIWVATINQNQGTAGRMYLLMTARQQTQSVDVKLVTPKELVTISNVNVPFMTLPSFVCSPVSQLRSTVYEKAECEIKKNKVNTFDEVIYSAPLTRCWSVIAKDCSEEPKFVVLVKNVDKEGTEKKVKIISADDVYELELVKEEIVVRVNGKTVRGSNEEYSIERLNADVVLIELKEVVVRFDGETVKVELSNTQMNTQCGLCGHFNGEKDSELRTASNEETDDLERVHRSYIVKHEECEMDESRLSEKKNYKMFAEQDYESDYEVEQKPLRRNQKIWESSETQEDDKISKKTDPKKETHVIEFAHRICFSLEPVPTCATNQVNFRSTEKKVKFTCLPRHEPEARRLKAESLRAPLHIQHMPVSFVENILVPQACEVY